LANLNLTLRLRPIRFGFVVRPDDTKHVDEIFRINTCLWGGKFNPIIPFFKRLPSWWEKAGFRLDSAVQVVNGYLDFFEPDFIVEAEAGIAKDLGFDRRRVLQFDNVMNLDDKRRPIGGIGLSSFELYKELYANEFQFVRRHPQEVIKVESIDKALDSYIACIYGGFPKQKALQYFEKGFKEAFDPKIIKLDSSTVADLYGKSFGTALKIGHSNLKINYSGSNNPTLFVFDATEPKDLIDFWNYRAVYQSAVPVPIQYLRELSNYCKEYISNNHRPILGNPHGTMIDTTVIVSRSIKNERLEDIRSQIDVDLPRAMSFQHWYPPLWRKPSERVARITRPTIEAEERKLDIAVDVDKPRIVFNPLHPKFSEEYGGGDFRWANVIEIDDWTSTNQIATVFPTNYRNPQVPKFGGIGGDYLLPTTEGLVTFPRFRNVTQRWSLPDGTTSINEWFSKNKIKAILSDAGRSTQQIIQTLGGFGGVSSLAHPDVVKLLDEMARKPVSRSCHYSEFKNKVNAAISDEFMKDWAFEKLVNEKAVELGLEVKCSKCGSWNWCSVKQLDYTITCELCLRFFDFPITEPGNGNLSRWAYRVIGPFALPDYSRGGYSAALSIRCISDLVGGYDKAEISWSSGQVLTLNSGKPIESDFILWYQRKRRLGLNYPTEIIFGEAKSFGQDAFKDEDVARMKTLAEEFPGAILVFSTMREASQLTNKEITRLKKLAEWGREYDKKHRQTRAPVIVLTGTELFAPHELQITWKERGGKYAQFDSPRYWLDNLHELADATQQLYLGMPNYGVWLQKKWNKRRRIKN
jgi:hypothetical protein